MQKKRILTGDRPTGPLHLGHYVGSVRNRVRLQDEYDEFVIIADVQALTTNFDHPEQLRSNVLEVALDYLACGIDPQKSTILVQSMVPEIAELTSVFGLLVTVQQLSHNPTIKTEAAQYNFGESMPYGFLGYPVSQAADIAFCRAHLVPVGEDQVPHIELTRKIVRKFNAMYAPVLVEPEAMVSEVSRLVGLDGNAKMSKSLGNAIYLKDTPDEIKRKVQSAVTDPARIHSTDKGHPDICVVYAYHRAFNSAEADDIGERCKAGTIGCVPCKKRLMAVLNELLDPIRERRAALTANEAGVWEMLAEGTAAARREGAATMELVREALHINYFPLPRP
ncbi:MAG: tryptophan--tRNA ligase [bacterium]